MTPQEFVERLSGIRPLVVLSDDDSILIEWITDDWRLGVSLEPNDDPFWILVSKRGVMETGKVTYRESFSFPIVSIEPTAADFEWATRLIDRHGEEWGKQ